MTNAAPTRLAAHPGEHNARRFAQITQARARKDFLAQVDATYIPILREDGTRSPLGFDHVDFPDQDEVHAINRSLALAYAVQNKKTVSFAMQATAWEAFQVYDAGRLALDAVPAMECVS